MNNKTKNKLDLLINQLLTIQHTCSNEDNTDEFNYEINLAIESLNDAKSIIERDEAYTAYVSDPE